MTPANRSFQMLPAPKVLDIVFAKDRDRFTHTAETYRHWILFGPLKGRFRFSIGDHREEICSPGEFLICPPGVPLQRVALEKISFHFIRFHWPARLQREWRGKHTLVDLPRMRSTLEHLEKVRMHSNDEQELDWASHLMMDLFQQSRQERRVEKEAPAGVPDRLMIETADQMKRTVSGVFNLEQAAAKLRLTPSSFSRRFKAAFGINPSLYRTQRRMQ
jgi:AraC-like DNA-binding protein